MRPCPPFGSKQPPSLVRPHRTFEKSEGIEDWMHSDLKVLLGAKQNFLPGFPTSRRRNCSCRWRGPQEQRSQLV